LKELLGIFAGQRCFTLSMELFCSKYSIQIAADSNMMAIAGKLADMVPMILPGFPV
jgi:hypothetical protein